MTDSYTTALKKEVAADLRAMEEHSKKVCATKKGARAFLVRVGIYDKKGRLTRHYR